MSCIVIATSEKDGLHNLVSVLTLKPGIEGVRVKSGKLALEAAEQLSPDLIIVDENLEDMNGLVLVQRILTVNAFINTAVVSKLSDEDFHEASEGLGVLMKLPLNPGKKEAELLLKKLESIS